MSQTAWLDTSRIRDLSRRLGAGKCTPSIAGGRTGLREEFQQSGAIWIANLAEGPNGSVRHVVGSCDRLPSPLAALAERLATQGGDCAPPDTVGALLSRYDIEVLARRAQGVTTRRSLQRALAAILSDRLDELGLEQQDHLQAWLDDLAIDAGASADRTLHCLRGFFNWGREAGHLDSGFGGGLHRGVRYGKPRKVRARTLSVPELAEIWAACRHLSFPFDLATRFLIATGASMKAVTAATWDMVKSDDGTGLWETGELSRYGDGNLVLPLYGLAVHVLSQASNAERRKPSSRIFSSTGRDQFSAWPHAKLQLDHTLAEARSVAGRLPFPLWQLRDIQKSFEVWAGEAGLAGVAQVVLNKRSRLTPNDVLFLSSSDLRKQTNWLLADWNKCLEQAFHDAEKAVEHH